MFQSLALFMKAMVQGPTHLANVGAGSFSTWDAVHHTFPVIGWYWVLGVHKLLPQGPEGTEGNLDGWGGGGARPYGWIRTVHRCRGESQIHMPLGHMESTDQAVSRCACV